MLPTIRLIILAFLGSLLIALIGTSPLSLFITISYNSLIIAGIMVDLALTPRKEIFAVSREYDYKMSLLITENGMIYPQ